MTARVITPEQAVRLAEVRAALIARDAADEAYVAAVVAASREGLSSYAIAEHVRVTPQAIRYTLAKRHR